MLKDFLSCACKDSDCGYEYITNSYDNIQCPNCGNTEVDSKMIKAVILNDWSYEELENSVCLKHKLKDCVENLRDSIDSAMEIRDTIEGFCKENNLEIPSEVNLVFKRHFDYSEEGDLYLDDVEFKGSNDLTDELNEELIDLLWTNYSLWELQENTCIKLK